MNSRKVLIVGAGVAGPTLAYWLDRFGFEPTLVERAPALRVGGYIIDFWGLGFDVAEKMGLAPALRAAGYEIEEVRLVDKRGRRNGGFSAKAMQRFLGDHYVSILRSDLSRLIFEALAGRVRTVFGDTVTGIVQHDDGVEVAFEREAPERFDLAIGAGGLHSPVRGLAFGAEDRYEKYLGYYAASFTIQDYPHRDFLVYVGHAAPGRQATRYLLRDGSTVALFVFARPPLPHAEARDPGRQRQILRDTFGRDGWEVPELLDALDDAPDLYFDAVSQIHMDRWSNGRVVLVGDACFCPSLLAGQGSALAMAAAYVLAGELKNQPDHVAAFQRYQSLFHPFIAQKQAAAARFAGSFAPRTSLGIYLRNQVTRLMSLPFVADWAMGGLLRDRLALPDYG